MDHSINGDRIKQAREIRGLTQTDLATAVGVDQSYISWIELGAREPSDVLVNKIAIATQFPPSFFRRDPGPEFPLGSLLFRRRQSLASDDRDRFRQVARLAFEVFQSLADKFKPMDMRVPRVTDRYPAEAAGLTRTALGLSPDTPVTHLINKLERNGVFILALPIELKKADAFSVWADTEPRKPIIALTSGWPGDRQRFSIAHELGHLVMHQTLTSKASALDDQANAFAAEFLLPEEAMRRELEPPLTLTRLAELKSKWGVSIQVLTRRGESLGVITEGQRKYLDKQLAWKGWIRNEPVAIEPEKPRLLRRMAESLYGIPTEAAKVAQHVSAPTRLMEDILAAHASKSEVMSASRSSVAPSPPAPTRDSLTRGRAQIFEFGSRAKRG